MWKHANPICWAERSRSALAPDRHYHLLHPILAGLQTRQTTNELLGVPASQAGIDLGRIVELVRLNRLLAGQPLYNVIDWRDETVLPQVADIVPEKVYANRLGRALDRVHPDFGQLSTHPAGRGIQVYDSQPHTRREPSPGD